MSLLMEALRKAEEAKRQAAEGTGEPAGAKPGLTLAPLSAPASPLPDLSLHADALDAELAAVSAEPALRRRAGIPPQSGQKSGEETARAAVQNVFEAKKQDVSRARLWPVIAAGSFLFIVLAAYFGWQWQMLSKPASAFSVSGSLPSGQPPPSLPPASLPRTLSETPPAVAAGQKKDAPPAPPAPRTETDVKDGAVAERPLQIKKSTHKTNMLLENAYADLQANRLEAAGKAYEQVLRADGKNLDALLGLATLAVRKGQPERAMALYLMALESDPNDVTAQAGLISLKTESDPGMLESRLKTMLASRPEASALHFSLGNLYARQQRWGEAQQAYFRAYGTEPDNPEILFNLAVSLDHLHQDKLAAQYYQRALDAAMTRGTQESAAFDAGQVRRRIAELRP